MHASLTVSAAALALLLLQAPALAQLSGGLGSSNSANQSFQMQNQMRGMQQNQTFQNNQVNSQMQRDRLYNPPSTNDGMVRRRR